MLSNAWIFANLIGKKLYFSGLNLHFSYNEQRWTSFHRFKRYFHFFSVNCLFIPPAHFCMVVGLFFYSVFKSSLFICGITADIFFPMSCFLFFSFFLHEKVILFSCGLIYQFFILLVLDFETSFLYFQVKKGIYSSFLLGHKITSLMIITFSPSLFQIM